MFGCWAKASATNEVYYYTLLHREALSFVNGECEACDNLKVVFMSCFAWVVESQSIGF